MFVKSSFLTGRVRSVTLTCLDCEQLSLETPFVLNVDLTYEISASLTLHRWLKIDTVFIN